MPLEKILMPQLGESVTEGTISGWLVRVGQTVHKYDPIAEVMTDKVNAEVPSSFTGTIKEITVEEGETVAVGELICYIETEATGEVTPTTDKTESGDEQVLSDDNTQDQSMKKRYSPAVLRLSQEHDIDLSQVDGTGKGGRITRKDVEKIIETGGTPKQPDTVATEDPQQPTQIPVKKQDYPKTHTGDTEIPVTGVRKAIAENMVRAKKEIPHAWMMVEVDVTNLVKYRNSQKDAFKASEGFNLTYFAFFLKAVSTALRKFPQMNSSWAGEKIIQHKAINLSIAVGKGQELFVPVIRNVDEKSIKRIAKDIDMLAMKARSGSLTTADMQGGTFTVNNTGSFGSIQSMGVINYPQAAILQVESIVKKPVIIDDMFAARDMVNLCLSLDHRVLDGLICGQFMSYLKEILENVSEYNTPIF
ncbi:dihydrolipoamide acetyltransferase family protein [Radiobacillus sp. PE A8.2]|uniref:dihydrolipoamide acetyltransferase family protein n=1 Tax=Radiobacillus sp. PE A8.2 TaxID=3380349 RepID=UPI00388F42A8